MWTILERVFGVALVVVVVVGLGALFSSCIEHVGAEADRSRATDYAKREARCENFCLGHGGLSHMAYNPALVCVCADATVIPGNVYLTR